MIDTSAAFAHLEERIELYKESKEEAIQDRNFLLSAVYSMAIATTYDTMAAINLLRVD